MDYPGHIEDPMDQEGSITNIWWAWEGYPFFYPTVENSWGYGMYLPVVSPTGGVQVPTNGVYSMIFRNAVSGRAVESSEIVASIKRLPHDKEDLPENWETISRKVFSTARGNIYYYIYRTWADMWGIIYDASKVVIINNTEYAVIYLTSAGQFSYMPIAVYGYCFPLNEGDIVTGWLKATDIENWQITEGGRETINNSFIIDLIGLGFGAITGIVRDQNGMPVEGATVEYDGPSGLGTNHGETLTNDEGRYIFYEMTPDIVFHITASKTNYTSQVQEIRTIFNTVVVRDLRIEHL